MKKHKRKLLLLVMCIFIMCGLTACRKPYDTPEFVTIEASQTAFLIPLVGDTSEQGAFDSEEMLDQHKVATKEIQIPHRWVQTGRYNWQGEYRAASRLILVERKPVSRSWESGDTPQTSANAIWGGTKDGVGVYVGMSCSAQINEADATKFLYRYNNTPLEEIMDGQIKTLVRDTFNAECRKYTSTELNANKTNIIEATKATVAEHFKEYGITITVLGTNEDFSYENAKIQNAIDDKFVSEQNLVIQENNNKTALSKAQAEAEAAKIKAEADAQVKLISAEAEAEANKKISESLSSLIIQKMEAENEALMYEKWNGNPPQISGVNGISPIVNGFDK